MGFNFAGTKMTTKKPEELQTGGLNFAGTKMAAGKPPTGTGLLAGITPGTRRMGGIAGKVRTPRRRYRRLRRRIYQSCSLSEHDF